MKLKKSACSSGYEKGPVPLSQAVAGKDRKQSRLHRIREKAVGRLRHLTATCATRAHMARNWRQPRQEPDLPSSYMSFTPEDDILGSSPTSDVTPEYATIHNNNSLSRKPAQIVSEATVVSSDLRKVWSDKVPRLTLNTCSDDFAQDWFRGFGSKPDPFPAISEALDVSSGSLLMSPHLLPSTALPVEAIRRGYGLQSRRAKSPAASGVEGQTVPLSERQATTAGTGERAGRSLPAEKKLSCSSSMERLQVHIPRVQIGPPSENSSDILSLVGPDIRPVHSATPTRRPPASPSFPTVPKGGQRSSHLPLQYVTKKRSMPTLVPRARPTVLREPSVDMLFEGAGSAPELVIVKALPRLPPRRSSQVRFTVAKPPGRIPVG